MRDLLDAFIRGEKPEKPPLVILAEQLAARIGSMTVASMQSDSTHWVANQNKLRKLLSLDGVVIGADWSLTAEACGQTIEWQEDGPALMQEPVLQAFENIAVSGRQANAVESLTRLCKTDRTETGCIAMMTGPVTLAQQLFGDAESHLADVKPLTVELTEQFCQARPDLLLLREGAALGQADIGMPQRKAFNTLKNMAAYFDVPVGIYLEDFNPEILPKLEKLKLPFLCLGKDESGAWVKPEAAKAIVDSYNGIGLAIDFADAVQAVKQAEGYASVLNDSNYLLTSSGELDRHAELESLIKLTRDLHE